MIVPSSIIRAIGFAGEFPSIAKRFFEFLHAALFTYEIDWVRSSCFVRESFLPLRTFFMVLSSLDLSSCRFNKTSCWTFLPYNRCSRSLRSFSRRSMSDFRLTRYSRIWKKSVAGWSVQREGCSPFSCVRRIWPSAHSSPQVVWWQPLPLSDEE